MWHRNWYVTVPKPNHGYFIVSRHWTRTGARISRKILPYSELEIRHMVNRLK